MEPKDVSEPLASTPTIQSDIPSNLPTAVADEDLKWSSTTEVEIGNEMEMKELEDRAHAHNVLLSSDAMRHFITRCKKVVDRFAFLDRVITDAKVTYPSEDGWVVLSLTRMQQLCEKSMQEPASPKIVVEKTVETAEELPTTPVGVGSLAEAIVAGNVNAAYQMIEHRPMVALADAAADLDAVYRHKIGLNLIENQVSEMLKDSVVKLDNEQLKGMIEALTSAVDGTYADEQSAVKMAILKAVNVIHT